MIKKIKDLTKKERNKICSKYFNEDNCSKCPFCVGKGRMNCFKGKLNQEVEVDD